jgi:energy-coupling factor transport system ATP-binding protein
MVFQNPDNQIVANVVEEDVAFAPENLGVPSEEIRQRVDDALRAQEQQNASNALSYMQMMMGG